MNGLGRLHVITDPSGGRSALAVVAASVAAGAPVVQVRAKGCTDRQLYDFALAVMRACAPYPQTRCLVNDRVDVALAVGAYGTHVGADDLPVDAVRRVAGPDHLVGATARDPAGAVALVKAGAHYLGVGPAYPSSTKPDLSQQLGAAGVGAVAGAVGVPVIAIGGVTVDRVGELLAAGAYGVAVVSAISGAADPAAATRAFLAALAQHDGIGGVLVRHEGTGVT